MTSNERRGDGRYNPYAFTEQGVAMLSSVLRSPRAAQVNTVASRGMDCLGTFLSNSVAKKK